MRASVFFPVCALFALIHACSACFLIAQDATPATPKKQNGGAVIFSTQDDQRQHDGGHTDVPNIPHFIKWANRLFEKGKQDATLASSGKTSQPNAAKIAPIERNDPNSALAHRQLIEKAKQGKIDVYFIGDSITRRWGATDYPVFLANWKRNFYGWNAANFGWGGDTTQNVLWRMQNGELEGVDPKVFVLQAGTNNLPSTGPADASKVDEVVSSLKAIVDLLQQKSPNSKVVITAIFPRPQNPDIGSTILQINDQLEKLADGKTIRYLNINGKLTDASGALLPGMSEDGLHLTEKSYQVWADGLKPIFHELLGPPSTEDHAPPPTGDPKASKPVVLSKETSESQTRVTTPGAVEIPEAVRIRRPTTEEIAIAEKALAAMIESADPRTKAIFKEYPSLVEVRPPRPNTAVVPNLAPFFRQKHEANVAVAKKGEANLLFMGDSITDFWRNENGPFAGKKVFDEYFAKWKVANFGIAGDTTQGVLYRLQHGEGEGFSPSAVMLMIGTNNSNANTAPEIAEGIGAIVLDLQKRFPKAKILLLGIFPRGGAGDKVRTQIKEINQIIAKLHDGNSVHFMDIGNEFLDADGNIPKEIMSDALHPSSKGYEIWAKAVADKLQQLVSASKANVTIQEKKRLTPQPIVTYPLGEDSKVDGDLKGKLEGPFLFRSKILENTVRKYWIYVPSTYTKDEPAAVLVFQDGARATNPNGVLRVQNVLENLSVKNQIPTTIGIFITPGQRGDEFPEDIGTGNPNNRDLEYDVLDDKYARFIIEEMLPEVGKSYNLTSDPALRAIGGSSSGAICAFTVAWHRPDQFRNVISMIGSFTNIHGGHVYPDLILSETKKPIRIFLQDGINDLRSPQNLERDWYLQNQKLKAAFAEKGYDFAFVLGDGGHSDDHGGAMLPQMLRWIWRDAPGIQPPTNDLVAEAAAIKPNIADPFPGFDSKRSVDAAGTWKWERTFGPNRTQFTLQLTMEGNKVAGTLISKRGDEESVSQLISDVELHGNKILFNANNQFREANVPTTYAAIINDNKMVGWTMSEFGGNQRDTRWECRRE